MEKLFLILFSHARVQEHPETNYVGVLSLSYNVLIDWYK